LTLIGIYWAPNPIDIHRLHLSPQFFVGHFPGPAQATAAVALEPQQICSAEKKTEMVDRLFYHLKRWFIIMTSWFIK
jgi:hypothetical protein